MCKNRGGGNHRARFPPIGSYAPAPSSLGSLRQNHAPRTVRSPSALPRAVRLPAVRKSTGTSVFLRSFRQNAKPLSAPRRTSRRIRSICSHISLFVSLPRPTLQNAYSNFPSSSYNTMSAFFAMSKSCVAMTSVCPIRFVQSRRSRIVSSPVFLSRFPVGSYNAETL